MRQTPTSSNQLVTRINVTPIIDVALVLVIILLVTAPMLTVADLELTMPEAEARGAEDERSIHVTLSRDGELAVADIVVNAAEFGPALRRELSRSSDEYMVVVRADEGIPYTRIRDVLNMVKQSGANRVAIGTRQKVEASS